MKISEQWLREWVQTDLDTTGIAERLTSLGLEVDSVQALGEGLDGIVVGHVLEVQAHPNADRLSLCRVDGGQDQELQIVCGAANVAAGNRYPLAMIGASLPGGLTIERAEIRDVLSEGMLCSAAELGLAESADGILTLAPDLAPGLPIAEALQLDDAVIDVDLTPNRADCFSMLGVARDLAAGIGAELEVPRVLPVLPVMDESLPISLGDPEACPGFAGRVIRDLNLAAESPVWLKERLRRAGVRPLNPIVDVTNYVMLELGQPMHAYDLDGLSGSITARQARSGESLELLDGRTVELDDDVLVIADDAGPVAMAGIMGGAGSAVGDNTRNIFLESAFFTPASISGRSRRYGLHTDASVRFERGVDPAHQARAIERATALLLEIAGGRPGFVTEVSSEAHLPARHAVSLRRDRLAQVLGVTVPDEVVSDSLTRLDMRVETNGNDWMVTPPPARFDIALEVDLIEEIARIYGYDNIPEATGTMPGTLPVVTESRVSLGRVRAALVAAGYQEAVTWSFGDPELDTAFAGGDAGLALANPISSALAVMRQSLWPGLCQAAERNLARQQDRVRLFETGVRFILQGNELKEETVIAGLAAGAREPEQWDLAGSPVDLFDIKSTLEGLTRLGGEPASFQFHASEHPALRPGRSAQVRRGDEHVGDFGELHPSLVKRLGLPVAPVLFELRAEPLLAAVTPHFEPVSKFPAVRLDLAFVVADEVAVGELMTAIRSAVGKRLTELRVFDLYTGEKVETGSKSVAFGLILQDTSRTLTDEDADSIRQSVVASLSRQFNASIRE
jgi:phenylalanyl-tRNA synthetase beta chain